MNKLVPMIVVLALIGAGLYVMLLSPSAKAKAEAKHALQEFSDALAAKDRDKTKEVLAARLDDAVRVHLTLESISITQQLPPLSLDFDKAGFIAFFDATLGRMSDYSYEHRLEEWTPDSDKKSAALSFDIKGWSDGMGAYGATQLSMRFSGNGTCKASALLGGGPVRLSALDCRLSYRAVPRAGELEKVKDQLKQQIDDINQSQQR